MKIPKYFYFRVRVINKGTGVEVEDASDVDVVEVVRCRDCKQFVQTNAIHDGECPKLQLFVNKDYYCWWGERREDGTN